MIIFSKLFDWASKRMDEALLKDYIGDVRYWVGYIDGLRAAERELKCLKGEVEKWL